MAGQNANDRQIAFHRYQGDLRRLREAIAAMHEEAMAAPESDLAALLVKRFEVAFESGWQAVRSHMDGDIRDQASTTIKRAIARGILAPEEGWMDILATRNATVHKYSPETAKDALEKLAGYEEIFAALHQFLQGEQS